MSLKKFLNCKKLMYVICFLLPAMLIFFIEFIHFQSIPLVATWGITNLNLFFISYIFIALLLGFVYSLTGSATFSVFFVSFASALLSIISYLKTIIRGDVLVFSDIFLLNTGNEILSFVKPNMFFNPAIIFSLLWIILMTSYFFGVRKNTKISIKKRIPMMLICICLTLGLFFTHFSQENILPLFGIDKSVRYTANDDYTKKGLLMGLYFNYLTYDVQEPPHYSFSNIQKIFSTVETTERKAPNELPNVVIIMSESFTDVTRIPNVTFSKDPIPTIHQLQNENVSGTLVSSTYGGGTSNIEFEVFTGNTISFLPYGVVAFTGAKDIFERDIPTIMKDFKNAGYTTNAIHTYTSEFYDRKNIYPKLGFDHSYFLEDLTNPTYDGLYVSDDFLTDEVINILDHSQSPTLVYALSMQNHLPYSDKNYQHSSPIDISSDALSDESLDQFKAYIHGLNDADTALHKLITYLENSDKPTIVLFYGDHSPSLNNVFYQTNFVSTPQTIEWSLEEMYQMHQIPFVLYDNYSSKKENVGAIGTPFLGNYLLNYVGIEKSSNFKFLDTLTFTSIRNRLFVDKDEKLYLAPPSSYQNELNRYEMLQYDILYGEEYYSKINAKGDS